MAAIVKWLSRQFVALQSWVQFPLAAPCALSSADRALVFGTRGRGSESLRAYQVGFADI